MRTLGWMTVGVTYVLMVFSNWIASTTHSLSVTAEWSHRALNFAVNLLTGFILYQVLSKNVKTYHSLKRPGITLLSLVILQTFFKAIALYLEQPPFFEALHFFLSIFILGEFIILACGMTWKTFILPNPALKVRRLATSGLIGLLIQVILGGTIRAYSIGLACPSFPLCLDTFFPIPFTFETALTFAHRWWGFLMLGLFVHLALVTRKQMPSLARTSLLALVLGIAQVLLGIETLLGRLQTHPRMTHAAVGYALWGVLFFLTLRTGGMRWLWDNSARKGEPS